MKEKLSKILSDMGAMIVDATQAEHMGTYYCNFKASEIALKEICKLALRHNLNTAVYIDGNDEIAYRISIPYNSVKFLMSEYTISPEALEKMSLNELKSLMLCLPKKENIVANDAMGRHVLEWIKNRIKLLENS